MTMEEFNEGASGCVAGVFETLRTKSEEYTAPGDVFSNFRQAGALLGCAPERALMGMLAKHLVSIAPTWLESSTEERRLTGTFGMRK